MFMQLLIVTFTISLAVCFIAEWLFRRPILAILTRIIGEELSAAWQKYIRFAIYVVGISGGGARLGLEKYITPRQAEMAPIVLTARALDAGGLSNHYRNPAKPRLDVAGFPRVGVGCLCYCSRL